MIVAHNI